MYIHLIKMGWNANDTLKKEDMKHQPGFLKKYSMKVSDKASPNPELLWMGSVTRSLPIIKWSGSPTLHQYEQT